MNLRLLVKQRSEAGGADAGTEVILDDDVVTLGRDTSCQVVLAQQAVSRSHARISRDGSLAFVEDLGSAYGTQINGKALPPGEKRLLRNGDVIGIAQFDIVFDQQSGTAQTVTAGEKTSVVARQVVKDIMRGLGEGQGPSFRLMNGAQEGQRIELADAQELIFGRDPEADVVLNDELVSRQHAKVRRDWAGTHVEDLRSRNGIRVNQKRVLRKTLRDRDELEIGGVRLLYLDPSEVREAPLVLAEEEDVDEEPTPAPEPAPEGLADGEEGARGADGLEQENSDSAAGFGGDDSQADGQGLSESSPDDLAPDEEPEESFREDELEPSSPATGIRGRMSGLSSLVAPQNIIALGAMGFFALLALVVMLAVMFGA